MTAVKQLVGSCYLVVMFTPLAAKSMFLNLFFIISLKFISLFIINIQFIIFIKFCFYFNQISSVALVTELFWFNYEI